MQARVGPKQGQERLLRTSSHAASVVWECHCASTVLVPAQRCCAVFNSYPQSALSQSCAIAGRRQIDAVVEEAVTIMQCRSSRTHSRTRSRCARNWQNNPQCSPTTSSHTSHHTLTQLESSEHHGFDCPSCFHSNSER